MRSHHEDKENQGNQHRAGSHKICGGKREVLSQHAAGEDADAQTEIPSCEVGGSGGAALGVGAEIDEQGVEGGECRTETQTATQGNQQEGYRGVNGAERIDIMAKP